MRQVGLTAAIGGVKFKMLLNVIRVASSHIHQSNFNSNMNFQTSKSSYTNQYPRCVGNQQDMASTEQDLSEDKAPICCYHRCLLHRSRCIDNDTSPPKISQELARLYKETRVIVHAFDEQQRRLSRTRTRTRTRTGPREIAYQTD
jgi:hypothetical protein